MNETASIKRYNGLELSGAGTLHQFNFRPSSSVRRRPFVKLDLILVLFQGFSELLGGFYELPSLKNGQFASLESL